MHADGDEGYDDDDECEHAAEQQRVRPSPPSPHQDVGHQLPARPHRSPPCGLRSEVVLHPHTFVAFRQISMQLVRSLGVVVDDVYWH